MHSSCLHTLSRHLASVNAEQDIEKLYASLKGLTVSTAKFLFAGNGGSFAIAQHIAAELTGRFIEERPSICAYVLGSNQASMSAIANDYGYETVFARELSSFDLHNSLLILMSTSGKSKNILQVLNLALSEKTCNVLLLVGHEWNGIEHPNLTTITTSSLHETARIQEYHLILLHELCRIVDKTLVSE